VSGAVSASRRPPRPRLGSRRRPAAFLVALAAVLLPSAYWFPAWLAEPRTITTSAPTPFGVGSDEPLTLGAGAQACADSIALGPRTQALVARAARVPAGGAPPPLVVDAGGPGGYRASATARAYRRGEPFTVPFAPPRAELLGTVCVRNGGDRAVALSATTGARTASRSTTRVDGAPVTPDLSLQFVETGTPSYAERAGAILDRMETWSPAGRALLWLVVALVVLGFPLGVAAAWALAPRD